MVVSVHHYELSESADESDFRAAVAEAERRNLFERVPGLIEYRIGQGIKGDRAGRFAAIWIYESKTVWEDVWGSVDDPNPKSEYPDAWLVWEDDLLAPILAENPDRIEYTSYELVADSSEP